MALNAAKIASCSQDNDTNLKILESLYTNQTGWVKDKNINEANESLKNYIEKKGFKLDFNKCINDKKLEDYILNDRIEGSSELKVKSTPTLIINYQKFKSAPSYENIKKEIDNLLKNSYSNTD
ncbi:Thioredoxin [seawater metagenome]|uniref:Thioredoxin n=1 Tax=seawater metagenome TaxID=1561972 RepID=A0A5E8CHW8_9ZZZZ